MDTEYFKIRLESLYNYTVKNQKQSQIGMNFFMSHPKSNFYDSISEKDKNKIITTVTSFKLNKDLPKLQQFFVAVSFYSRLNLINPEYMKRQPLIHEVERIKSGLFTSKTFSNLEGDWCRKTYGGFLRSLKQDTLQIVNVDVEGEMKTMLLKSNAGDAVMFDSKTLSGYHTLLMDPKTLDVYSFTTSDNGKIVLERGVSLSSLINDHPMYKQRVKDILIEIKKELPSYIRSKKKNYLVHYENKLAKNSERKELVKKRINKIFSEKKINSFTRSFGRSKSRAK